MPSNSFVFGSFYVFTNEKHDNEIVNNLSQLRLNLKILSSTPGKWEIRPVSGTAQLPDQLLERLKIN